MASERIPVAAGMLAWARRTSGYDVAVAAKRMNVGQDKIESWERGESHPTINQLRRLAKLYTRPFAVLLLPAPPKDFDVLRDFRRTGEQEAHWSPALHAAYKRALSQREVLLELSEVSPSSVLAFDANMRIGRETPAETAGERLRELVGMNRWSASTLTNSREALRAAIAAVEGLGILVLQTRDVGIGEMRGFSFSEWPYPAIVLNGSDWPRPKLFTLLHELCHLMLNAGGLCDLHEPQKKSTRSEDQLEHYCNQAAAIALMPRSRILAESGIRDAQRWSTDQLGTVGNRYGASGEALLLRLVNLGVVPWDRYWELKPELEDLYADVRRKEKERQKAATGGPSYFLIQARNLGHGYVHSVLDAFYSRAISSYDVADYLDVRFDQLPKLQEAVQR